MTTHHISRTVVICFVLAITGLNTALAATPKGAKAEAFRVSSIATLEGRLPRLTAERGGAVLSWISKEQHGNALRAARIDGTQLKPPFKVSEGERWFLNPFDRPSVVALSRTDLSAHWLERTGPERYAYGIRMKFSSDDGQTWGKTIIPHLNLAPVQHGFVHLRPTSSSSVHAIWLDGGKTELTLPSASEPMALLSAHVDAAGQITERSVLDGRVCTCCQPTTHSTEGGWVVAYRDRSLTEVRDITVIAGLSQETHTKTTLDDGWEIAGCPLNGPVIAPRGSHVAVAWFTAANDRPQVRIALSKDSGRSFEPPKVVATGTPLGQVSATPLEDGSVLVSWLEFNGVELELRVRRMFADTDNAGSHVLISSTAAIFAPQMVCSGGTIYLAREILGANRVELSHLESSFGACTR